MERLVVMGVDAHLDTLAAAVLDETGRQIAGVEVANTGSGWAHIEALCVEHSGIVVGIEGASSYGHRLAQSLHSAGIEVREMPTRLTAATRRVDGAGKTDPGDARTVARAVARGEGAVWSDTPSLEVIRVLSNRRDQLVSAQTAAINQMRALLVEVDPEHAASLPRLRSKKQLQALTDISYTGDTHRETVGRLVRDIATECVTRHIQILELERELEANMPTVGKAIIAEIHGAGTIVTATLLAELAGTNGFTTDAQLAAWAGTSPLDASSGRQQRHRLNRGGNRKANTAIHTIIQTQFAHKGEAHTYIERRRAEGKTHREALRAAKRHVTRRIHKILRDHRLT